MYVVSLVCMHVCRIRPYGYRITCIQSVLVCMHVTHARVFVYVWLHERLHMHVCMYVIHAYLTCIYVWANV